MKESSIYDDLSAAISGVGPPVIVFPPYILLLCICLDIQT